MPLDLEIRQMSADNRCRIACQPDDFLNKLLSALKYNPRSHIVHIARRANQTILFISHRISALKWVDRIVVLNQGTVEDQGTHEQLIARSGLYSPGASVKVSPSMWPKV